MTPEQALAAALRTWWYADRPLLGPGGDNLDDVLANDARIILAALSSYTLVSDAELERLRALSAAATPGPWNYDYNKPELILAEDGTGKIVMGLNPRIHGSFEGAKQMTRNTDFMLAAVNYVRAALTRESSNAK